MTACSNDSAVNSDYDNQEENRGTTPAEENEEDTNITSKPVDTEVTELSLRETILEINESHQADVSAFYFTQVLGIRKTYENSLPSVLGFEYPYIYYKRNPSIIQGASQEEPDVYVGRYSVETKEKQEFAIENSFSTIRDSIIVVNKDCLVYMHTKRVEQLMMVPELCNFADGTHQILDETPAHNVFGYAKQLDESELIFLMYESTSDGARQTITRYNLLTNELVEIHRGEIIGGYKESQTSSKDVWAIDAYNGEIYLFMQQYSENRMHYFMQKLDRDGNVLSEEKIDSLSRYSTLDNSADSLVILDNYAVVHYAPWHKSPSNTNPPTAVLYHTEDGYKLFDTGEKIKIWFNCGTATTDHLTAFFEIHNDDGSSYNDTIFACNARTNEGISIHIDGAGVRYSHVDSKGNLLVETRDNDKSHWYVVPASEFLEIIEN